MVIVVGGVGALLINDAPERRGFRSEKIVARRCACAAPVRSTGASVSEAITSRPFVLLYLVSLHRGFDELIVACAQGRQRFGIDQHLAAPGYAGLALDQA